MEHNVEQLLADSKKRTIYARITACMAVGIFLAAAAAFLAVVPKALHILEDAEQMLTSAETAVTQISAMSESITATSTNLNTFITDNSQMLTDAVTNMNSIDYDKLNQAITDLQTAVEPFANFMSRFN